MEKHDNTQTFSIRICTIDHEKVIHQKLIIPVSFLTIPTESEGCGFGVSDLTTGATDDSVLEHFLGSVALPDCESRERAVSLISQISMEIC